MSKIRLYFVFFAVMIMAFSVQAENVKPALLFITGGHAVDGPHITSTKLVRKLSGKGFVVDAKLWRDIEPDTFNKYDCVIFFTLGQMTPGEEVPKVISQRMEMLDEYIKSGGAVLANPYVGEAPKDLVASDLFLKKYGAAVQIDDITDPVRKIIQEPWHLDFTWTDKINREFLGLPENDKYLWYPIGAYKYGVRTYTFKLGEGWTPIASTDDSATLTTRYLRVGYFDDGRKRATKSGNFPFIAAKQEEDGRLAVSGIFHPYTFTDPFALSLGGVFTDKGFAGRRSCGFDLIVGLFKWLTADSTKIMRDRPSATNPKLLIPRNSEKVAVRERRKTYDSFRYRKLPEFVKGAIFELPDSAEAEDYITAAKDAGLRFAVFAKRTSAFPEKRKSIKSFKIACLNKSSKSFNAIPAIVITDEFGGTLLYTGENIMFPADVIFDDAKQLLVTPKDTIPGSNGGLGDAWMHYAFGQVGSMRSVIASMDHKNGQYPASDYRDYNSMVVISCEDGQVIEDMLPEYLRLQDRGENLLPLALHKILSPEQIADIVNKNFWIINLAEDDISAYFARNHMLDNPTINITSGPHVNYWFYKGGRDFSNVGDLYDFSQWHFTIKLDVTSDVGLDEVIIYDGQTIFRRYKLNGDKHFVREIPVMHSSQHNFVLAARDTNGGEVITAEIFDRSSIGEEFMCGDRNNQFFYSAQRRLKNTNPYFSKGLGYGMSPNKGPWSGESAIYSAFQEDPPHRLKTTSFDGGPGNCVAAYTLYPGGIKGELPLRAEPDRVLNTSDIAIGKVRLNTGFPKDSKTSNVWHTLLPVLPTLFIDAEVVQKYFIPRPEDDFPTLLQNVRVKFKKQNTPSEKSPLLFELVRMNLREPMNWIAKSASGTVFAGTFKEDGKDSSKAFALPFGKGSYLRIGEGTSGSYTVVSMTNGLILYEPRNSKNFFIGFPNTGKPVEAGEEFKSSFLFIGEPFNVPANNMIIEKIVNAFFKGFTTHLKIETQIGTVVDRRTYPIEVKANNNSWKADIDADIAVAVPFRITGLNPDSTAYLYSPSKKGSRPLEVLEDGSAYLSLPGNGREAVVVCNPILTDAKGIKLVVAQNREDEWFVYAENLSDKVLKATLKMNPDFTPFDDFTEVTLTLSPYESKRITLKRKITEALSK